MSDQNLPSNQNQTIMKLPWDEAQYQAGGDYWATASSDMQVELALELQLFECAMAFYAPGITSENLRLRVIATLHSCVSLLEKYRAGLKPIGENKDKSLLDELKSNIQFFTTNSGFDEFQLWRLYNIERELVLVSLGEIGFRKNKKGQFSWLQKQMKEKAKLIGND